MTQKFDRFKAAPWFVEGVRTPVLIGGAGGIGSWLTLLLNRAGFETHVFDFDRLEPVNMAGQLFMHKSIGKFKVEALTEVVREIAQEEIIPYIDTVTKESMTNDIVFSAFDNMKARRDMFESWLRDNSGNPKAIFIDGRLTLEQMTIFCVRAINNTEIEEYEKVWLFDDSKVPELNCTAKQTSHAAAMIAGHMVTHFTNWYAGILGRDESRIAPFYWDYYLPLGYLTERDANAIQEAEAAMLEDVFVEVDQPTTDVKPHFITDQMFEGKLPEVTMIPNPILDKSEAPTDRPGVGGGAFQIQLTEEMFGQTGFVIQPEDQIRFEGQGEQEAAEISSPEGLSDEEAAILDAEEEERERLRQDPDLFFTSPDPEAP